MKETILWTANHMPPSEDRQLSIMALGNVAKARFFHTSFPQYSITPLARLDGMSLTGLGSMPLRCWADPLPWPGILPSRWAGMSVR